MNVSLNTLLEFKLSKLLSLNKSRPIIWPDNHNPTKNQQLLFNRLLLLIGDKSSNIATQIVKEWSSEGETYIDCSGAVQCACSHPINNPYSIRHCNTNKTLTVGCDCVQQFEDGVLQDSEQLKRNPTLLDTYNKNLESKKQLQSYVTKKVQPGNTIINSIKQLPKTNNLLIRYLLRPLNDSVVNKILKHYPLLPQTVHNWDHLLETILYKKCFIRNMPKSDNDAFKIYATLPELELCFHLNKLIYEIMYKQKYKDTLIKLNKLDISIIINSTNQLNQDIKIEYALSIKPDPSNDLTIYKFSNTELEWLPYQNIIKCDLCKKKHSIRCDDNSIIKCQTFNDILTRISKTPIPNSISNLKNIFTPETISILHCITRMSKINTNECKLECCNHLFIKKIKKNSICVLEKQDKHIYRTLKKYLKRNYSCNKCSNILEISVSGNSSKRPYHPYLKCMYCNTFIDWLNDGIVLNSINRKIILELLEYSSIKTPYTNYCNNYIWTLFNHIDNTYFKPYPIEQLLECN